MRNLMLLFVLLLSTSFSFSLFSKELVTSSIHDLDERLTNLELKQALNKIHFGMELNNYIGHFKVSDRMPENNAKDFSGKDDDTRTRMNSQVRLAASASLSKEFAIYTQFESNFHANSEFNTNNVPPFNTTYQRRGVGVFVRRAYFDYHFNDMFTFSMGRLPTTNGPPQNVRNNMARRGTYPLMSFSIPIDGVAGTFRFDLNQSNQLIFRTILAPGGLRSDDEDQTYANYQVMSTATSSQLAEDSRGFTQMAELRNRSSLWDQFLFIFQGSRYSFGALKDTFVDNIDTSAGLSAGRYRLSSSGPRIADLDIIASYMQIDRPMQLPLTLYFSHAYSKIRRRGSLVLSSAANPYTALQSFGFLSNDDVSGNRWLIGLNLKPVDSFFMGAEYMKSTKYAIPAASYTDELTSFLDENGEDFHGYIGVPIVNTKSVMRFGGHYFKRNQTIIGNVFNDSSENVLSTYILFNMRI
jgi:hypothetical protein